MKYVAVILNEREVERVFGPYPTQELAIAEAAEFVEFMGTDIFSYNVQEVTNAQQELADEKQWLIDNP